MAPPLRTSGVVKGANYKRRKGSILNSSRVINNVEYGIDETYASFLQHNLGGWESQFVEEDAHDPMYVLFLDNLKECGNRYMLGVSKENGVSFPIKYEVEDGPPDELKRKTPRSRGSLIQEMKNLDLDNVMYSDQKDSAYVTTKRRRLDVNDELNSGRLAKENFLRRSTRTTENSSYLQRGSEVNLNVSGGLRSDSQRQDTPSHTLVGKRLKSLVGNSEHNSSLKHPSLDAKKTTGHNSRVMQNSLDPKKTKPAFKLRIPHSKADTVDELYGCFIAGLRVGEDFIYYESPDGKRVYYEVGDQQESDNDDDDEPQRKSPTPQPPTPPPRLRTPPPRAQTDKDDSHTLRKLVVNNSKAGDQQESDNDDDEPQRNSPTPLSPTPPSRLRTPPPRAQTNKDDSHTFSKPKKVVNNSKAAPRDYSEFWNAVKKDLSRPFEQKEYEDLLERVNARKPIGVHKETRSGGYTTEFLSRLGASYLDSFPDLKHEIKKAKSDPFKVLNLLRGFFIYLQKLPQGVPKPWKN